jgi:Capsule assembly protein Wzi
LKKSVSALAIAGLLAFGSAALADGVSGYLPLNLAPRLEHDVERLMVLASQPVVRRPIALAVILDALPAGCEVDEELCMQVQRELAPWLGRAALGMASFEAAIARAAEVTQPNQRGAPEDAKWQVAAAGYVHLGEHLALNAGGVAYRGRVNPTGSYISIGGARAQLDIGFRDHWWSPLRDSSMLLSTEAPTIAAVTLSNSAPLTRAKARYEIFIGRLSHSSRIGFNGGFTSGNPLLSGFSLSIEPVSGWSISGSRIMEFGGGARHVSTRQLIGVFFNSASNEQVGTNEEFGNQQVSISSQLIVPGAMPMSVYVEYAAEDTFHSENYRFGNGALSAGIFLPRLRPNLQARYEFSNWEDVWYEHHLYLDGMRNYGRVLGNWGADWRRPGDYAGGQSHMLQLNWERDSGAAYTFTYRTTLNAAYTGQHYRRAHLLSLAVSGPWHRLELGGKIELGRDMYGAGLARLAGTLSFTGDASNTLPQSHFRSERSAANPVTSDSAPRVERFVEAGVMAGKLTYEQDFGSIPTRNTHETGAHYGVGVRRSVSARSDFGARLELDQLHGHSLISLRALDYRYRMGSKLAVSGFFGFSRYDTLSPAHGYYMGAGVQWRNVLPGWDLNFDMRYADRIVRKKITPGEVTLDWPNEFYTLVGGAVYLSRRF